MIGAGPVQVFPASQFANADTLLSLLSTGATVTARVVPASKLSLRCSAARS